MARIKLSIPQKFKLISHTRMTKRGGGEWMECESSNKKFLVNLFNISIHAEKFFCMEKVKLIAFKQCE